MKPWNVTVIASAEKLSVSTSPRLPPSMRVGAARAEPRHVEMLRAAADLFVRREGDADGAVRDLGMRDEIGGGRHDLGDAGLVVGAEQRRAGRGDDVVADLLGERGIVRQPQHRRRIVRQHEIAAVVAAVDDRLDARAAHFRRRVDVRDEADRRHVRPWRVVAGMVAVT